MTLRIDDTGFGGIRIVQDREAFCYGTDAVLLADFAAKAVKDCPGRQQYAVDLGTGTGIIPLILSHKTDIPNIWGVEFQKSIYRLAEKNIEINSLNTRLKFFNYDIMELMDYDVFNSMVGRFDIVTSNPPYTAKDAGIKVINDKKYLARQETTAGLEDFLRTASTLLKHRGMLFMINRPTRLVDIMVMGRRYNLEPKVIRLVSGKQDTVPNMVLIKMIKNAGKELKVLPQLNIYNKNGQYTDEIMEIYERKGELI